MKSRGFNMNPQVRSFWRLLGILLLALLFLSLASSSYTQVPATDVAVAENQFTGQIFTMQPVRHFWPLDPRIVPFAVTVTKYDLRRQIIEIGAEPADGALPFLYLSLLAGLDAPGECVLRSILEPLALQLNKGTADVVRAYPLQLGDALPLQKTESSQQGGDSEPASWWCSALAAWTRGKHRETPGAACMCGVSAA